jgi:hypothetical protein
MLKAVAAVGALLGLAATSPACADTLLTGAVRDQAGVAVAGARVIVYDSAGKRAGENVASADGTFAIAADVPVAQVGVSCDYCRPLRRALEQGVPVVVIVERFMALTQSGPSAADIRALPYRSAADLASLRPFAVVEGDRISDRGLGYEGAVLIDGLPFYRAADANDLSRLVAAHATVALTSASPLEAPVYGGYANAGLYDVRLRDPDLSTSRFDIGEASDIAARVQTPNGGAGFAASSDAGEDRQSASVDAEVPLGGGRLALDGVSLSDLTRHAAGAGLAYATDSRRFTTAASLSATQSVDASLLTASAFVRSRGPLQLEYGARAMRATSALSGAAGAQFDAGLYARAARETGISRLSAALALDRGSDSRVGVADGARGTALAGSLADDVRLGSRWSVHAGVVSSQRIPTFAELSPAGTGATRSLLFEQSVSYTDLQRLRLSAVAYTARSASILTQHINGIGVDAAWQITSRLSLRSWVLRANRSAAPAGDLQPPYGLDLTPGTASALTRRLIWLSYDRGVRLDVLIRGGALEGAVRIPLDERYGFSIGSAVYYGSRITTFGLTLR